MLARTADLVWFQATIFKIANSMNLLTIWDVLWLDVLHTICLQIDYMRAGMLRTYVLVWEVLASNVHFMRIGLKEINGVK